MHDYRAIFLDIDGTLTQPGHSAPPVSAVAVIESARRAGRRVFLCTGRCEAMLKPLLHCADFDGYVASSGGLVVVGSRDVFDCPMTPQEQAHVLTALSDNGVFRTVQTRMGAYCDEGFRDFLRARDVQNASGVKQVCAAIGVDPADSICFGDSLNDLPMFAAAGFSVCMGNGGDAAKQSADAVCDSVEAGGLAKAFADFGLLA